MTAPLQPDQIYRVVTDYEALQSAFIERAEDLDISRITIDVAGEFTPGYSAKLLCQPPMKTLGKGSLAGMLKALGLALVVVVDDARFAEVKAKFGKPKRRMRAVARIKRVRGFFTKENAREHGTSRWADVPADVRKKMMRKVAKARWKAHRRRGASLALANAAIIGHDQPPAITQETRRTPA